MLPAVSPTPPFPLRPIGTYSRIDVTSRIAEGGMGAVYRAVDKDGRPVAVKLLSDRSKTMIDRFMREIAAVEDLNHPNIVQTLGHGEDREYGPFIVMELLTGRTLEEVLGSRRYGRLSAEESSAIASQICGALIYAHSRELVHRDIKPENIFVCNEDPLLIKVMDFGIARAPDADEKGTGPKKKLTEAGIALGTLQYIAPEQCRGKPGLASDVYALGIMLYLMIEGRFPFLDHLNKPEDLVAWHLHGIPREMTECRSPILKGLVLSMLAKKPIERPKLNEIQNRLNGMSGGNVSSPTLVEIPIAAPAPYDAETARVAMSVGAVADAISTAEAMTVRASPPSSADPAIPREVINDNVYLPPSGVIAGEISPPQNPPNIFVDWSSPGPVPPPQTKAPKSPRTWWPLKKFSASIQRVLRRFPKG